MHQLLTHNLPALHALCRKYGVRRLDLFGSAAAGDFDPARSDLDFLVDFDPAPPGRRADQYFGFLADLEALFGRAVDLVEVGANHNPYFLASVNATRMPLYAAA